MLHRLLFVSALLAVPAVVVAQEVPPVSVTNRLEEVVVTGTRIPTEVETAPNSITVVPHEQIEQTQAQTVQEVLRDVPGVEVAQTGQPGGQTSVFLRGANGEHTLVLIDGVRVNNAFNSAFDFANLPVDNIDHIEILRGPQGTLYGSEAMGGVINIVTKRGAAQPTGSVLVEGGSDDAFRSRGSFAGTFGKLSLSAATSYFSSDNERTNSEVRIWDASGQAAYQLLERLDVSLLGTWLKSHAGTPNDRFTNDPNDFLNNENSLVVLKLHGQPTEWWDARLTLSHAHERGFFDQPTPNPPFFFGPFSETTVSDRDQIDFQNIFSIGDQHKILAGGSFDNSHADDTSVFSGSPTFLRRTVEDKALYGQYDFSPMSRLTLTGGGRVDDYTTFGAHGTYRFAARFTAPETETIFRASVGTGFRAPPIRQLSTVFGNPNLDPEESLGWEFGVEQPLLDNKLHVGATYFQNEFNNLIGSGVVTNIVGGFTNIFSGPLNIGKAETLGVETFATWTPFTNVTVRGAYTWLAVAEDRTTNQRLLRRPEHSGSLDIEYGFWQKFTANLNTKFVGPSPDMNFSTFPFQRVTNAGHVNMDLGLAYDPCKYFRLFFRVENLLDDKYEEVFGFPALGRTFWGGGMAKF
ncbi:MAG: TonB-dependent receptor [Verrucomicrobiia bacterium]